MAQSSNMLSNPKALLYHLKTIWLFTVSDHVTFVLPETLFGILGALSGPLLTTRANPDVAEVLRQIPRVVSWTWLNTFIFVLSNQGSPDAIEEDKLNKPWRPLPAGRITPAQIRRLLLFSVPCVLKITHAVLGSFVETTVLFSLTWMYNEMKGGDESFVVRNLIIAAAYVFYGSGALRVAIGAPDLHLTANAVWWLTIKGAVIFTTMSVQDLKDQAGDRARQRRTAPLVLGDSTTRGALALLIIA